MEQAINYDINETCTDDQFPADPCHKFYWGYEPESDWGAFYNTPATLVDQFDVRAGLYRAPPFVHTLFIMDNIKVTDSVAAMLSN